MLLVGEPGSGKTTVLRSMAQELARQKKLVSVIDERRELFAGMPRRTFPGEALDVISGIPKGQAVQMALRTLSPQVLLLDELGGMEEVSALEQGMFSGVDFVATLHAGTPEEAVGRPQIQALQARGAVKVLVWLQGRTAPGQIRRSGFYERKQSARIWGALPCALRLVCRGQHLRADIRASAGASKNHRIT